MIKDVFLWIVGIVLLVVVILGADYFIGYKWFSFIAPKKENVRREVFLNTRSYNEGKMQDLIKLRLEYIKADKDLKPVLKNTILHMFAEYDESKLPLELVSFLKEMKYGVK